MGNPTAIRKVWKAKELLKTAKITKLVLLRNCLKTAFHFDMGAGRNPRKIVIKLKLRLLAIAIFAFRGLKFPVNNVNNARFFPMN